MCVHALFSFVDVFSPFFLLGLSDDDGEFEGVCVCVPVGGTKAALVEP